MTHLHHHAPDASYVRDTYDTLLTNLPRGYTHYRWQENAISRFHYYQSKRALLRALRMVPVTVDRVLEVGGGAGTWTPFFAARARRLDFLDISERMLDEAKTTLKAFEHIHYMHADFLTWEPESGTYDLVVSIRNLEYMPDKRSAIATMARALKSGGWLILSTKSPNFDWKGYFKGKQLHGGQIALPSLRALLAQEGFAVVNIYPAIMGKKIRYALVRACFNLAQWVFLRVPLSLVPLTLLASISESFLVVARRV